MEMIEDLVTVHKIHETRLVLEAAKRKKREAVKEVSENVCHLKHLLAQCRTFDIPSMGALINAVSQNSSKRKAFAILSTLTT